MSTTEFPPPPPRYPPVQMADSIAYHSPSASYIPHQTSYYPSPPLHHGGHTHEVSPQPRQDTAPRKRPKYTRSKTGCLTCRVKKIKCDEAKPSCMRCAHGQRDCTWPEGVPARKRASSVKESPDGNGRPSTSSSTASPGTSSPSSTRGHSPSQRSPVDVAPRDLNLPPLLSSRRQDSSYLPRMHHPAELDPPRREYSRDRGRYSPPEPSDIALVSDMSPYPPQSRYETYTTNGHIAQNVPSSRHLAASSVRTTMNHPGMQHQQWSPPPIMSPNPPPGYYHHQERQLVHSGDQMPRYH
ncbi:Zn(2)-C6 fungal-type domain-containing protein [Favolaschia claudopus]|uniref:Zn(2)-C6 fungal-type domain-containing protein n=1 Tax=Favolaschia claudopus TaxID=2862362 RepID=A0AAW0AAL2_9AGAR